MWLLTVYLIIQLICIIMINQNFERLFLCWADKPAMTRIYKMHYIVKKKKKKKKMNKIAKLEFIITHTCWIKV